MVILKDLTSKKTFYVIGMLDEFVVLGSTQEGTLKKVGYDTLEKQYKIKRFFYG